MGKHNVELDELEERQFEFELAKNKLIKQLSDIKYVGDLSDLGNEIGIVLGSYTESEIQEFKFGLNHGISLTNGTHG